jgi:hypothetical protein
VLERFNPTPLFRGHWRGLSVDTATGTATAYTDLAARVVFAVVPLGLVVCSYLLHWELKAPGPLLSGVSLLAGGLLASFGQLTSFRQRLYDSMVFEGDGEAMDRNMVDETVAHLLLAAFLCGIDAALLVIGLNVSKTGASVTGLLGAAIIGVSAYIGILFLVAVPRLYVAYATYNKVSRHISGTRS